MAIPEGYTELGRIGFVDKGNYSATTTYRIGDVVYYNGSTWSALKDNLKGVTPSPGVNWKYMARGFAAELLADVTAKDTSGVLGTAGANVTSQALIDAIADRVMTKLLAKTNVTNNLLTTEAGYALDARQGKALKTLIDNTNSDLIRFGNVTVQNRQEKLTFRNGEATVILDKPYHSEYFNYVVFPMYQPVVFYHKSSTANSFTIGGSSFTAPLEGDIYVLWIAAGILPQ